jgi:hypothetical protein
MAEISLTSWPSPQDALDAEFADADADAVDEDDVFRGF